MKPTESFPIDKHAMRWRRTRSSAIADFIRYTFKPLFGFVFSIGALAALIGTALTDEPLAHLFFYGYITTFFLALLVNLLRFIKYKKI